MVQQRANRRPLCMGASHSLRINKDYIGQAAIDWLNEQENANQAICRAVDFYYRYFEGGEYQDREDMTDTEDITQNHQSQTPVEKSDLSEHARASEEQIIDQMALMSLKSMINSVKR